MRFGDTAWVLRGAARRLLDTFARVSDSISRTEHRERPNRQILQALAERRIHREARTTAASTRRDGIEHALSRATVVLWETAPNLALHDPLDCTLRSHVPRARSRLRQPPRRVRARGARRRG